MIDMVHGQRLTVRSLVEAKQGRRVVHKGQRVHIYKTIADSYDLGKDRSGNFGMVLQNVVEGVHFEIIPGEMPFPEKTILLNIRNVPFNFDILSSF